MGSFNEVNVMEYTGERMVPEGADVTTYLEHVFRYAFACKNVRNRKVLDIASGEGYGTYALSKVASGVIGIDVSAEAVAHAKSKYGLDFRVGNAERIPLESGSFDAVVSFETVEHVPNPRLFIEEIYRVLRPGGMVVISTPNKEVYHHGVTPNPYHCSEMTRVEFLKVMQPYFQVCQLLGQTFPHSALDCLQKAVGMVSDRLGYYIRRKIEMSFLPVNSRSGEIERNRVVEKIPTLSAPLGWLWNPFALRKFGLSQKNQPRYFIVVAVKRKNCVW